MFYVFSVLPTPEVFIEQLNISIYSFLWKGPDKIARLAVINDLKYGGLNLTDLETSVKSLRLAWLGRLFAEGSSPWKAFVKQLLKEFGGIFLIMMSKNTILILYFIKNFIGDGQTSERNFRQNLQFLSVLYVIYQTRETVFHRDIQTPRRELKIRRAAEYF